MKNKPLIDIIMDDTFKKEPPEVINYYVMMYYNSCDEILVLLADKDYKPMDTFDGESFLIKLFKHSAKLTKFDEILDLALKNEYILSTINKVSKQGQTPLMVAVECGLSNVIDELLKKGADVNIKSYGGRTLAMMAVENCSYTDVIKILDKNIDLINVSDTNGNNILHYAGKNRFDDLPKWAYKYDLSHIINAKNEVGNTPIFTDYMSYNKVLSFECMVDLGADLNIKNRIGLSVIDMFSNKKFSPSQVNCFCYLVDKDIIKLKLKNGCEVYKNNFSGHVYLMLKASGKIDYWNAQYTKKALLKDINSVKNKSIIPVKKSFKM